MRILCYTVDDFIKNIEGAKLYDSVVWSNITSNPLDDNKQKAVKFEVCYQASTVKKFEEGGECLVELGIDCGIDYHDSTQDFGGTEKAYQSRDLLKKFCDVNRLKLLPGILDM